MRKLFLLPLFFVFLSEQVKAHCPLCTIGAAAVAGGAAYFGVKSIVIGLMIGAFSVSMGYWISRMIKKKYIPYQDALIILLSFVTTIIPIAGIVNSDYSSFYLSLFGEYGSLLNRTYILNNFVFGSLIGSVLIIITPWISKKITVLRKDKIIPFQGVIITLTSLIILGVLIQFL